MGSKTDQKIERACTEALEKFNQIDNGKFDEVKAKLEYVLGSYQFDHNPVGLYEIGGMALEALKKFKAEKPRQVSKKLLTDIEKALAQ